MISPFDGVLVATVAPMDEDGGLDLDRFQDLCDWLVTQGVPGVVVNGSLGEYQLLSDDERESLVRAAVQAVGGRAGVVAGVSSAATATSVRHSEAAARDGACGVMCLPPVGLRVSLAEMAHHFGAVSAVGLPLMAYNDPSDTKMDLEPDVLAALSAEVPGLLAVKDFSGDVTRVARIRRLTPLAVLAGADDVALECFLMGATGWVAGFANALPRQSVALFDLARAGRFAEARASYEAQLPLLRWDRLPQFVQAIKHAVGLAGRPMGPVRAPRLPLAAAELAAIEAAFTQACSA